LPGVYVLCLQFGETIDEDRKSGFFDNMNRQIGIACGKLASNPKLYKGFNAIGFSQGGLFLR
jgi:palmitoyl-protein thioesterase